MQRPDLVFSEVPGLYRIVPLKVLRCTPGVSFDEVPREAFPRIDSLDRVLHQPGAVSPGPVGNVERPWYMHSQQDDNLLVLHGTRHVDVYTVAHGKVETFSVSPNTVRKGDELVFDGPAMLVWPRGVFHRVRSCEKVGSACLNLAVHYGRFDIRTNFSIYDLDPETGRCRVIRPGHLDQPGEETDDEGESAARNKKELYRQLASQLEGLLRGQRDLIGNAANTASLIYGTLPELNWAGFYFLDEGELKLGPFQGGPACTRIVVGKGVCGKAAAELKTIVVENVHEFPGHIACDTASNSEIVIPLIGQRGRLIGVLDLDSPLLGRFDAVDQAGLEKVAEVFVSATQGEGG